MKSRTHRFPTSSAVVLLCGLFVCAGILHAQAQTPVASSATKASSELVGQLTKGLSVTPTQAKGGAGALFQLAKTRLTEDEFSKVSAAVPGMGGFLKAAPPLGQSSELTSLESALPGNMGSMGRVAETAEAFHKLGLSPEMAVKFLPVMTKFVESKGGLSTASLLEKALK